MPVPEGAVAEICVSELTVKLLAAVPPKLTAVAPVRLLPVSVTDVPPLAEPWAGLIAVIAGAARWIVMVIVALWKLATGRLLS